mgnify:CR=1 FL=1
MIKQTLKKICPISIVIVVFILCFTIQGFSGDILIKNLTFAHESSIPDFPTKPSLIYQLTTDDLTFYIGIENPVSINLIDSTVEETALASVLENPRMTVLVSQGIEKIPVESMQLKETIFEYLRPVILAELQYTIDEDLQYDGGFLNHRIRLQRLIDISKENFEYMKDYVLKANEQLSTLDTIQETLGFAFRTMLTGGSNIPLETFGLASWAAHTNKYATLAQSLENVDEKIDELITEGDFQTLYDEYPLEGAKAVLDFASDLQDNIGRSKDLMKVISSYYILRELNFAFGPSWMKESIKYIGKDGFLTSTAKNALKEGKASLLSLLSSVVKTDTRHAQITGLKIASNLSMQLILLETMQELLQKQQFSGEFTYEYADSLVFLLTVYRFLDNDTSLLIQEYDKPQGLDILKRTGKFIKNVFEEEIDLDSLILLNKKELAFYLDQTYKLQDYAFKALPDNKLKSYLHPFFRHLPVDTDIVLANTRILFKNAGGKTVYETSKLLPVTEINGNRFVMIFPPLYIDAIRYIALDVQEVSAVLDESANYPTYSKQQLGFSDILAVQRNAQNKHMILMIHGWQPFKKDAFLTEDGTPLDKREKERVRLSTWDAFIHFMNRNKLDETYDIYAYTYDGVFSKPSEFARILSEYVEAEGLLERYDHIFIIAHSMGGMVSRYFMNTRTSKGDFYGDHITRLITVNTPHEGSPMGNLYDIVEQLYLEKNPFFYSENFDTPHLLMDMLSGIIDFKIYDMEQTLQFQQEFIPKLIQLFPTMLPLLTGELSIPFLGGLTTPYPAYRSLGMTDSSYNLVLSKALFGDDLTHIFKVPPEAAELNANERFADKILAVCSFIDFEPLSKSNEEDIDLRVSNYLLQNELLRKGGKGTKNDGVVPLSSQQFSSRSEQVSSSVYANLAHNQILSDAQVIQDIFFKILSDTVEENKEPKPDDSNLYKKLLEEKYDEVIQILNERIARYPETPYYYQLRGLVYSEQGSHSKAVDDYLIALHYEPDNPSLLNNLGVSYSDLGDLNKAFDNYTKSINIDPKKATTFFNRAGVYSEYYQMGDEQALQMALNDYYHAITLKPDFASAYSQRGLLYYYSGDLRLASEDYETAIEQNIEKLSKYNDYLQHPEKLKTMSLDDLNFSIVMINLLREQGQELRDLLSEEIYIELAEKLIEQLNNTLHTNYSNAGSIYFELGDYERSRQAFINALDYIEESPATQRSLAKVYMQLEDYSKAIEKYLYCIEQELGDYSLYMNLGQAYSEQNLIREALDSYSKAIELNPSSYLAYHKKIAIYCSLKDFESALSEIQSALRISPENTELYDLKSTIYFNQGNYRDAATDLSTLIQIKEKNGENTASIFYMRGLCYLNLGDLEKAKEDLTISIEKGYSDNSVYRYLAEIFSNLGDYQSAINNYEKLIERQGYADDYTYYQLGVNYYQSKQYEMAVESLTQSIHYNPQNHQSLFVRGLSYYYSGKKEQAVQDFETSAAMGNQMAKDVLMQLNEQ